MSDFDHSLTTEPVTASLHSPSDTSIAPLASFPNPGIASSPASSIPCGVTWVLFRAVLVMICRFWSYGEYDIEQVLLQVEFDDRKLLKELDRKEGRNSGTRLYVDTDYGEGDQES